MAGKQSMAEALQRNKQLRDELNSGMDESPADSALSVVKGADRRSPTTPTPGRGEKESNPTMDFLPDQGQIQGQRSDGPISTAKVTWVRHTVGLRDTTKLTLQDAAEVQKRKDRYGQLAPGEPSNEQEIADLGINLALRHIGFVADEP